MWAWVSPGSLSCTSGRWSGFGLIPALVLTVEMEQHLEAGMPGFWVLALLLNRCITATIRKTLKVRVIPFHGAPFSLGIVAIYVMERALALETNKLQFYHLSNYDAIHLFILFIHSFRMHLLSAMCQSWPMRKTEDLVWWLIEEIGKWRNNKNTVC